MNNDDFSRGDLLYLPANVTLYQFDDGWIGKDNGAKPRRYEKTEKPINVLVLDKKPPDYIEVLFESQPWLVHIRYAYKTGESTC
jgi:hypothetical protein